MPPPDAPTKIALLKNQSSDFWDQGFEIHRLVPAASVNQVIDLLSPPGISTTAPNGLFVANGAALSRMRLWASHTAPGENVRLRIYTWPRPTKDRNMALTAQLRGQTLGALIADLTVKCSGAVSYLKNPITQDDTAGLTWFEMSEEVTETFKADRELIKAIPDPYASPTFHPRNLTAEVQTITMTATGGTFTVTFRGQVTAALAYDISTANLQTALQGLSSIGSGGVVVSGTPGSSYVITLANHMLNQGDIEIMTLGTGSLTGGSASIAETTPGVAGGSLQYILDGLADYSAYVEIISMGSASNVCVGLKRIQ